MIKDKIIYGATIGILADIVKLAVNYLGYLLGYSKVVFWQMTASRFLVKNDLYKPIAYLIGGLADLTIAALIGVAFIYLLRITGRDYHYIKGAGFGLILWVVLFGTVLSQSIQAKLTLSATAILVTAVAHIIYGLALSFFAFWLYPENVKPH
ncbi:MAG TPA: hypothetical protein VHR47_06140 [Bacillota bacterium]|nr:hypothetical protein [Bacillota bacterium]